MILPGLLRPGGHNFRIMNSQINTAQIRSSLFLGLISLTLPAKMTQTETPRPVKTDDAGTMARETAAKRWPDILQRVISSFEVLCKKAESEAQLEGDEIVKGLEGLMNAIQDDQRIK